MDRIACNEGVSYVPKKNKFLSPARLTIRRPDGRVENVSYGIGDEIEIMVPSWRLLVPTRQRWENIPMPDGSTIDDIPDDIRFETWW